MIRDSDVLYLDRRSAVYVDVRRGKKERERKGTERSCER